MSLLSKIGTKASRIGSSPIVGKMAMGAILTGAAGIGFSRGVRSSGINESFYEMTTGNPTIDKDVLGTTLTPAQALMPIPGVGKLAISRLRPSPYIGAVGGGLVGLPVGAASGAFLGLGVGRSRIGAALGGAVGAGVGAVLGGAVAPLSGAASTGFLNSKMLGAAFSNAQTPFSETSNSYSPNAFPSVDGSIVFGMNNARFG